MAEYSTCGHSPSAAASLFSTSPSFLERLEETKEQTPEGPRELLGPSKSAVFPQNPDAEDNQEDDADVLRSPIPSLVVPPFFITNSALSLAVDDSQQNGSDGIQPANHGNGQNEMERLRQENIALTQHIKSLEVRYERRVRRLQAQLQEGRSAHREAAQHWQARLNAVKKEQRDATENARKLKAILVRISNWARQLQKASQTAQQSATTMAPISPWVLGGNCTTGRSAPTLQAPRTPFSRHHESVTPSNPFQLRPMHFSTKLMPSLGLRHSCSSPPPAPGRRSPRAPHQDFKPQPSRVQYATPVCRPPVVECEEPIMNALPMNEESGTRSTALCSSTPPEKRRAGGLLAYCADLVASSLSGTHSSPSPNAKVMPAWKFERLSVQREPARNQQIAHGGNNGPTFNVGVPTLSLGVL